MTMFIAVFLVLLQHNKHGGGAENNISPAIEVKIERQIVHLYLVLRGDWSRLVERVSLTRSQRADYSPRRTDRRV